MVYTDGKYVIATSDRELQRFMKDIDLHHLSFNAASQLSYYRINPEHLAAVIAAGAKTLEGSQLEEKAQELIQGQSR